MIFFNEYATEDAVFKTFIQSLKKPADRRFLPTFADAILRTRVYKWPGAVWNDVISRLLT